ncbi:hypothetical protein [Tenacibaculum sp. IB213877]|uniref:hypothetical protein n=1 Tax=Tenacibaculum sp. IB213877 TaxID=3097351 RepID=UPI002A59E527|nr:hypothetical protein [Tenacibaculum sp. IB213877]MDY0779982.1 hypothetical protein [Tenacibaculum sp. IB213877]
MPANKKYLSSNWQRFSKITAGFIGGYLVTISLHLALAFLFNHTSVMITSTFTGFILWSVLMILAFLSKNGWKIWGVYILLTLLFSVAIYLGKTYNPII